jgi:hypothetical protein
MMSGTDLRRAASLLAALPLFLCAGTAAAHAQARTLTLTGEVRDVATGEPIERAVVELTNLRRRTTTDAAGRFTLERIPPGEHTWHVRGTGYVAWEETFPVEADGDFVVGLMANVVQLDPLRVTVHRREAALELRRNTSGMSVRSFDETALRRSAHATVALFLHDNSVLRTVPCSRSTMQSLQNMDMGRPSDGCVIARGNIVSVSVFIDEQRVSDGLSALFGYSPHEIHSVEVYEGGRMVRVYTRWFVDRSRAPLKPLRSPW